MSEKAVSENRSENIMGTMPVGRLLFTMAWPAILSMIISSLYNIVDSIFVAKVSEDALTAISLVYPVQMLVIAFSVGTGVGTSSLIARRLGAKRFKDAEEAAGTGFRLPFINWLPFLLFGIFGSEPFMSFYAKGNAYIHDAGLSYIRITTILCVFLMLEVMIEKILQGQGNMVAPMICSLSGALCNIILDPILIFGLLGFPALGVTGAAIATVTGQILSLMIGLYMLFGRNNQVRVELKGFKWSLRAVKEIYAVGFPSIVMQSIGTVMNLSLNAIIMEISKTGVAVLGAYFKLQSFIFMPCFGLNQGALPIFGYNYGARNKERLMQAFRTTLFAAFTVMILGALLFQLFPDKLLMLFDASEEMLSVGVPALRTISLCFIPAAFGIICSTMFQATGHGFWSLYASLIRQLIGIVPIAYILSGKFGLSGVWMSFPLSEILGTLFAVIFISRLYNKEIKYMNE